jgi:hypothetical protein
MSRKEIFKEKMYYKYQKAYLDLMINLYEKSMLAGLSLEGLTENHQYHKLFSAVDKNFVKKICAVGVRAVNYCPEHIIDNHFETYFNTMVCCKFALKLLNVHDIVNLFPPEKTYDGEKYGVKDYFYAKTAITKYESYENFLNLNSDDFDTMLSDLNSNILFHFLVRLLSINSKYNCYLKANRKCKFEQALDKKFVQHKLIRKAGALSVRH